MKAIVSGLAMLGLLIFACISIYHWLWMLAVWIPLFLLILAISTIPPKVEQAYLWHLKEQQK